MHPLEQNWVPSTEESLAAYVRRVRTNQGMSQKELADKAGIHAQSLGKIERGQTTRLKHKPKIGLANALNIPEEYLDAVCKGKPVEAIATLKFCPQCWIPGNSPDPMWTTPRSKYCFACGTELRDRCSNCQEPIASLKFRFCPYCGKSYKGETLS